MCFHWVFEMLEIGRTLIYAVFVAFYWVSEILAIEAGHFFMLSFSPGSFTGLGLDK